MNGCWGGGEGRVEENRASVCISPTVPQVWAYAFQNHSEDLDEELAFVLCTIAVMYCMKAEFFNV